eukprot:5824164-Alexandrium_andersonii.AAC.1
MSLGVGVLGNGKPHAERNAPGTSSPWVKSSGNARPEPLKLGLWQRGDSASIRTHGEHLSEHSPHTVRKRSWPCF